MSRISIIIVTHNSQSVIGQCLAALQRQTIVPESVILVDSGSADTGYLQEYALLDGVTTLLLETNIGFAGANNMGCRRVDPATDYVLFLNPDAFPVADSLERAVRCLEDNSDVGCISACLLGYNLKLQRATGQLDSTGVFRSWYGRYYDRGQGEPDRGQYNIRQDVPAACGAFLFCRKEMLNQVALAENVFFDPDFFLYKEDIELCLRMRKAHWRILYVPDIRVYHCRGWQERHSMPHALRLTAARSELLLYRKHPSPYMAWAAAKYGLVRWLRF